MALMIVDIRIILVIIRSEKMIPATAAERGDLAESCVKKLS
jgi:hypothetical protein